MGNSPSVRPRNNFQNKNDESWWRRVQENARAFFALRGVKPCPAGEAGAFDLLEAKPAPGTRQRQAVSMLLHGSAIAILLLLGGLKTPLSRPRLPNGPTLLSPPLKDLQFAVASDVTGKGGNRDVSPPSSGELPKPSPIVLAPPRIVNQHEVAMPVEPAIFEANSQMSNQRVRDLGLPWMNDRNRSNGPGGGNTIGNKDGTTVGTGDRDGGGGESETGTRYSPGMTPVKCMYCPDPEYTDEARHEKLQGSVTLRVLVTKEGRAGQVKLVKGLGLGLDEKATAAVRAWRFQPARDANKNAIAEWVTVEATYRLF